MRDPVIRRVDETTHGVVPTRPLKPFSIYDAADLVRTERTLEEMRLDLTVRFARQQIALLEEWELRRLLGAWVSEIEPVIYRGPKSELLGLGWAGGMVLEARRIEIAWAPSV